MVLASEHLSLEVWRRLLQRAMPALPVRRREGRCTSLLLLILTLLGGLQPVLGERPAGPCREANGLGRQDISAFYRFDPCFAKLRKTAFPPQSVEQSLALVQTGEGELAAAALYHHPKVVENLGHSEIASLASSRSEKVRFHLARALNRRGNEAAAPLLALLHDDNPAVRDQAAAALGDLGEKLPSVDVDFMRSEMRELAHGADWYLPTIYAGAIARAGSEQAREEAIDFLIAVLGRKPDSGEKARQQHADPRSAAALYLARIGAAAKRADLPLLKLALSEETPPAVRADALHAFVSVPLPEGLLGLVIVYARDCRLPAEDRARAEQILSWKVRSPEAQNGVQSFQRRFQTCAAKKARIYKVISESSL